MAGIFVGRWFQLRLLYKFNSDDVLRFFRVCKVDKVEWNLERIMLTFLAFVEDAEQIQFRNPEVKRWLSVLMQVNYELEDLLDLIATEIKRWLLASMSANDVYLWLSFAPDSFPEAGLVRSKDEVVETVKQQMKALAKRMEYLAMQIDELGLKKAPRADKPRRELSAKGRFLNESPVFGRDEDKEAIIKLLLSDDLTGDDIHVITIEGPGGVGKTTLAQLIYNDKEVKKHFGFKAWVSVWEDFDVFQLSVTTSDVSASRTSNIKDLNFLKEILDAHKCLLVFDNVCCRDYSIFQELRSTLLSGVRANGSKIIVTTRSSSQFQSIIRTLSANHLEPLPYEDSWMLFERQAFPDGKSSNFPAMKASGEEIVNKCDGLPLAIEILGSVLRFMPEAEDWDAVLKTNVHDWLDNTSGILPALMLSYYYLPPHLKQCFAYCSLFPKDHEYEPKKLSRFWMAEGFLEHSLQRTTEEGYLYFLELTSRHFFERSSSNGSCFVMHDLVNNLAKYVSGDYYSRVMSHDHFEVSRKVRHLSFYGGKFDAKTCKVVCKAKFLRTLLLYRMPLEKKSCGISVPALNDLFENLGSLRVLSLSHYQITELPDSVCKLKLLRYLDVSYSALTRLPDTIGDLCNLQTLILANCPSLTQLPASIEKLHELHYLDIDAELLETEMFRLVKFPKLSICVVKRRRSSKKTKDVYASSTLKHSKVSARDTSETGLRNKKACVVPSEFLRSLGAGLKRVEIVLNQRQLERKVLQELLLERKVLQELLLKRIASPAQLRYFPFFNSLPVAEEDSSIKHEGVSEMPLCTTKIPLPESATDDPINIEYGEDRLEEDSLVDISSYESLKVSYISQLWNLPPRLNSLKIEGCDALVSLPEELTHGPHLKHLYIIDCCLLKYFHGGHQPSALKTLYIRDCRKLEFPSPVETMQRYPRLELLCIGSSCNSLQSFPLSSFPELRSLVVWDCTNFSSILITKDHKSLDTLEIKDCPGLVCFPEGGLRTPNLTSILLSNCRNLKTLPNRLHRLKFLQSLFIDKCPELGEIPEGGFPSELILLSITSCHKLTPCVEWGLYKLNSLSCFEIECGCRDLESFPEQNLLPSNLNSLRISMLLDLKFLDCNGLQHLTSLETLEIDGCSKLLSFSQDGLPSSLTFLYIKDCSLLKSKLRNRRGKDWYKIAHIPHIQIDEEVISCVSPEDSCFLLPEI